MQDAEYVVTYVCGDNDHSHTRIIYLRGSMSLAAVEETLRVLGKTWCPACHRRQQQLDAEQYSHMFALVNLCVEADFWIEHRMILWDRQRTGETLADILVYALES